MSRTVSELSVQKSIVVSCPVEVAFRVFTEKMADWWPFEGHSVFEGEGVRVVFEGRVGGRVYEVSRAGEEGLWGTLTAWDPPHGFAMTWHPGNEEGTASDLTVRFSPEGDGTRLDLDHTGFERRGEDAREIRDSYDGGWDVVLGRFAEVAGRGS
jgi:Activator of Hsp90 ATPase homolog 1-like protein